MLLKSCAVAVVCAALGMSTLAAPAVAAEPPGPEERVKVSGEQWLSVLPTLDGDGEVTGLHFGMWSPDEPTPPVSLPAVPGSDGEPVRSLDEVTVHFRGTEQLPIPSSPSWRVFGPPGAPAVETAGAMGGEQSLALNLNSMAMYDGLVDPDGAAGVTTRIVGAQAPGRAMVHADFMSRLANVQGLNAPPAPVASSWDFDLDGTTFPFTQWSFNNVGVY